MSRYLVFSFVVMAHFAAFAQQNAPLEFSKTIDLMGAQGNADGHGFSQNWLNQLSGDVKVEFYGSKTDNKLSQAADQSAYVGPVVLQGSLQIYKSMKFGSCEIPEGGYRLDTIAPGQFETDKLGDLALMGSGVHQLQMVLSVDSIEISGIKQIPGISINKSSNEIIGRLRIVRVDGKDCGSSTGFPELKFERYR